MADTDELKANRHKREVEIYDRAREVLGPYLKTDHDQAQGLVSKRTIAAITDECARTLGTKEK